MSTTSRILIETSRLEAFDTAVKGMFAAYLESVELNGVVYVDLDDLLALLAYGVEGAN